jgi:hypothetical protein
MRASVRFRLASGTRPPGGLVDKIQAALDRQRRSTTGLGKNLSVEVLIQEPRHIVACVAELASRPRAIGQSLPLASQVLGVRFYAGFRMAHIEHLEPILP